MRPQKTTAERLQKLMAAAGLGSRRAIDKKIADGLVVVNGKKAEPGHTVSDGDTILFEDRRWQAVSTPVRHRTLIYNKPEGEVTTRSDPQGRPTVFDRLPRLKAGRWVAIGRLEFAQPVPDLRVGPTRVHLTAQIRNLFGTVRSGCWGHESPFIPLQ